VKICRCLQGPKEEVKMDWVVFGIGAFVVATAYIIAIVIGEGHKYTTSKSYSSNRDDPELF
jgi:hypothetical protein